MSNQIDDGGPAFPVTEIQADQNGTIDRVSVSHGMSLRDWFAGMALQALLTHPPESRVGPREYAKASYGISDAMLAARKGEA